MRTSDLLLIENLISCGKGSRSAPLWSVDGDSAFGPGPSAIESGPSYDCAGFLAPPDQLRRYVGTREHLSGRKRRCASGWQVDSPVLALRIQPRLWFGEERQKMLWTGTGRRHDGPPGRFDHQPGGRCVLVPQALYWSAVNSSGSSSAESERRC